MDGCTDLYLSIHATPHRMSLISHEACKELEDYLLSRLKKGNASAKHKCLLIMKHACRAGRADFKRDMQRQAEVCHVGIMCLLCCIEWVAFLIIRSNLGWIDAPAPLCILNPPPTTQKCTPSHHNPPPTPPPHPTTRPSATACSTAGRRTPSRYIRRRVCGVCRSMESHDVPPRRDLLFALPPPPPPTTTTTTHTHKENRQTPITSITHEQKNNINDEMKTQGEAPYQMVREAAKETLEAIYETAAPGGGGGAFSKDGVRT